jgi:hypothetical protein
VVVQRYFTEPCGFVPPYAGTFWCQLARHLVPRHLRRTIRIPRWQLRGVDHLRQSLRDGAGILLTPNHSRWADAPVVAMLSHELRQFFYFLVSYHIFRNSRLLGWGLNRCGAVSIQREGTDRPAMRASINILTRAERPLVLFPEGTWCRQNDRLGPLQEGVAYIARQAARTAARPVVIHPVAVKYWLLEDPRAALCRRLARLERLLSWRPQEQLDLVERIEKLSSVFLAVKEVEHFGAPRTGALDDRLLALTESHVNGMEKLLWGTHRDGLMLERVRRLRQLLVRRLVEVAGDEEAVRQTRHLLDDLLLCEGLIGHSHSYLCERPSLERLAEAVQRLEEIATDGPEETVAPTGAVVEVGSALAPGDFPRPQGAARKDGDPLVRHLAGTLQSMLDRLLAEGPPPEWGCPPWSAT